MIFVLTVEYLANNFIKKTCFEMDSISEKTKNIIHRYSCSSVGDKLENFFPTL